jgi:hypothetical protein
MDRLPKFDEMVAHPELLMPQKIPVDEDAILPYFTNLVEAVPGEFNATSFVMAHNIPFHELQACVALHIWSHSIRIPPVMLIVGCTSQDGRPAKSARRSSREDEDMTHACL